MGFVVKDFEELSNRQLYEILKSRCEVFMLEQNIICQDMDDIDYNSIHMFYEENGRIIAYLRAFFIDSDTVSIGRVLTVKHGLGYGKLLINNAIEYISDNMNCKRIVLNSQKQAVGFYEKFGFKVVSDEFFEEGVIHLRMELCL